MQVRGRRFALVLSSAMTLICLNGVAAADCGAPELAVVPASAASGQTLTVTGTLLRDGICYDTGGCLMRQPNKQRPSAGARLQVISPNGSVTPLGEFKPEGDTYDRVKMVRVPRALPPGTVTLQAVRKDGTVIAATPLVIQP